MKKNYIVCNILFYIDLRISVIITYYNITTVILYIINYICYMLLVISIK